MGWKSFLLRREAAKNLEMLPVADPKQLQTLQDVCSICYQVKQRNYFASRKTFFEK